MTSVTPITPAKVRTALIGDLIESVSTWNPLRSNTEDAFDYIDLSSVDQEAKMIVGARRIPCADAPSRARQIVSKGDVLVSTVRPNLNGVACVPADLGKATASTGFCVLRPRANELDGAYLFQWVKSPAFVADMVKKATGASYPAVSDRIIFESKIPLPSLAEQKRIAAILDKADAIRSKLQQSLRLSDDFLRSVFLDMFGDPVTNPKGWDKTTVGEEVEFLTSGSRGWAQYYADEGDYFIRIQNLRGGFLDLSDSAFVHPPESAEARRTRVRPGDVLLSITADLGRTAVVPENFGKGHINQHLAILRLKEMNPVFVSHLLASSSGQRQFAALNRSAVKAGLNFDDIRSITLLSPPTAIQKKFAAIVAKLQSHLQNLLHPQLAESKALFSSLQQRAFIGEL